MIRVNLAKTIGLSAPGAVAAGPTAGFTLDPLEARQKAMLKGFVLLIPTILLVIYERASVSVLQGDLDKITAEVQATEAKIASFGSEAPKVQEFKAREKKVEDEKRIIRDLSNLRLREVKALDALQNILPEKTWFEVIEMDKGAVKVVGYSLSETGGDEFVEGLKSTVFFSDIQMNSFESVQILGVAGRKFEMEFKIGKKEEPTK